MLGISNITSIKTKTNLITFKINWKKTSIYEAEEGMTVGEWLSSSYNVDKWKRATLTNISNEGWVCSIGKDSTVLENGKEYTAID